MAHETDENTEAASDDAKRRVQRLVMPGDVWRKRGPCDWVKVLRVQMPHNPDYDGGLPGCSVKLPTAMAIGSVRAGSLPRKIARALKRK